MDNNTIVMIVPTAAVEPSKKLSDMMICFFFKGRKNILLRVDPH
jgi:hypothetical protein